MCFLVYQFHQASITVSCFILLLKSFFSSSLWKYKILSLWRIILKKIIKKFKTIFGVYMCLYTVCICVYTVFVCVCILYMCILFVYSVCVVCVYYMLCTHECYSIAPMRVNSRKWVLLFYHMCSRGQNQVISLDVSTCWAISPPWRISSSLLNLEV